MTHAPVTGESHARTAPDAIEFECDLPEPPEKVWRALTVPELLAAWMMPNDINPEIGSNFAFAGPDAPIECEILDAEPGKRLRYSWRQQPRPDEERNPLDSIVTFTLARTVSGGTHLHIIHEGFARAATSAARPMVTMAGAGCRLSFAARASGRRPAANSFCLLQRAA
ncbi:ATPase [Mesorhizobium sp. B2-4-10]|uniref:SRPBCC family protein n=2 Tax=unclassified Mesorhizobium TaxID=325217 RepID=UPI00112C9728|nr:SRPBCC domain-containing protein [Mesorhizobium sp. B2-4-10]TPL24514.1 ATPase [Mesorhizobium sp. B2-4-10]